MRKSCYLYVGQIWSWWFPDFKKIGRTSFCLILGNPQPGCRIKTICSLFTNPKSLLPSSRHICTRYIARPAQNPFASTPTIYDPTSRIRQAESFFFLFSVKLKVPPAISETKKAVVKMTQFKRPFQMFKQLYFWISRFIRISGESQRLWQKSFKVFETEVRGTYRGFQTFFFSSQDVLPKLWINFQQGQQSWVFCKINPKVKLYSADKQNSPNYPCSGNLSESTTNWGKKHFYSPLIVGGVGFANLLSMEIFKNSH